MFVRLTIDEWVLMILFCVVIGWEWAEGVYMLNHPSKFTMNPD
jgi:hypothetical protein